MPLLRAGLLWLLWLLLQVFMSNHANHVFAASIMHHIRASRTCSAGSVCGICVCTVSAQRSTGPCVAETYGFMPNAFFVAAGLVLTRWAP